MDDDREMPSTSHKRYRGEVMPIRNQYIADLIYYFTGRPAFHFRDASFIFPDLEYIGNTGFKYVRSIAGDGFSVHREDFIAQVMNLMDTDDFMLQGETLLRSIRDTAARVEEGPRLVAETAALVETAAASQEEAPMRGDETVVLKEETATPAQEAFRQDDVTLQLLTLMCVILSVETPQLYLEFARKCTEHVKAMTSASASTALQFNHGQCAHLARKVELAFERVEKTLQRVEKASQIEDPAYPLDLTASFVGVTKHLCRCAEKVEAFIQSCRQDKWVQDAVLLWNDSRYVSSLCFDLDFCTIILQEVFETRPLLFQLDFFGQCAIKVPDESESVNEIVSRDQRALLARLEAMNESGNSTCDGERELVKCLSGRLAQHLKGVAESKFWEINLSSLKVGQRLGSGSGGAVRKSMWLGVEVAEKMFHGTDHPSFRTEVDILARLAHPGIVPLLGYATDETRCIIVMELMDGDLQSLMEERLRQNPGSRCPFTTSEAVDMMHQIAEGMRYLHGERVVHRDLKSSNILVKRRKGTDGAEYVCVKVCDFGLSKTKEYSSTYSNQTWNTGTTRWMAPELIRQGEQDPQTRTDLRFPFKVDVFSFGMVCYEILTGNIPFSTISSPREVKYMLLAGARPELPDECSSDLMTLIHACWQPNARDRPTFIEIFKRLNHVKYRLMGGSRVSYSS